MSIPTLDYASPPGRERRAASDYGTTSCLVVCFIIACVFSARILNEPALALFAAPLSVCGAVTGAAGLFQANSNRVPAVAGMMLNAGMGALVLFDVHRYLL